MDGGCYIVIHRYTKQRVLAKHYLFLLQVQHVHIKQLANMLYHISHTDIMYIVYAFGV
jgi:hypothetical protein